MCFRILIIELNENILQTYANDQILVISIHRFLNSSNNANNKNNINISWPKVITPIYYQNV